MTTCTRNGCGKTYDEATNTAMSCQYHTGQPKFHEGRRGWTCCPARGPHAHTPKNDPFKADLTKYDDVLPEPVKKAEATPEKEAEKEPEKEPEPVIEEDPVDAVVPAGATCKRSGCNRKYDGPSSCVFHPGHAVFHEGRQGWSCCRARATGFDEFLQIPGCTTGRHLFIGKAEQAKCRMDFFQSSAKLVVSVYARKLDKQKSKVVVERQSLSLHVEYMDGKVYDDVIELFAEVDPENSTFELLTTKIEISLAKAAPGEWPRLASK
ncbi:chord-domain-containing protein [Linderina pennispora]|uniref:Chord-domain-containing protein n=1 Tax=Linderina pennispora TaxID=61395 RepID=A0A1Y1W6Y1_9FUNG|nr:chord-domain-containing protein [Linderina pennispora]ORX68986.1 chord-domain-containing protein [Linderina pennispora]